MTTNNYQVKNSGFSGFLGKTKGYIVIEFCNSNGEKEIKQVGRTDEVNKSDASSRLQNLLDNRGNFIAIPDKYGKPIRSDNYTIGDYSYRDAPADERGRKYSAHYWVLNRKDGVKCSSGGRKRRTRKTRSKRNKKSRKTRRNIKY